MALPAHERGHGMLYAAAYRTFFESDGCPEETKEVVEVYACSEGQARFLVPCVPEDVLHVGHGKEGMPEVIRHEENQKADRKGILPLYMTQTRIQKGRTMEVLRHEKRLP